MAQGNMYIEKRKFKRIEKRCEIRYKLMPRDNAIEAIRQSGASLDLSIGGIRIEGEPIGQANDVLKIELSVEGKEEPVVTFAEIKWIREIDGKNQFGIEFLALKEDDKVLLERIINE